MHRSFLTMISISLFYCYKKVFALMNTQIIEKNSLKGLTWKRRLLQSPNLEDITNADCTHAERVDKYFDTKFFNNLMICMLKAKNYCWLMCLKTLKICVLKCINLNLLSEKKDQIKIRFIHWYWYVINGEKGITGRMCHANTWKILIKIKNRYILNIWV